jgi:acetyltransferase-like isoleucine patch superfamily enzyme
VTIHGLQRRLRRAESAARAQGWRLLHPGAQVGRDVHIGRGCRLFLDPLARLVLGDGCTVEDGSTIAVYRRGYIELGPRSFIGHYCTLAAYEAISVGEGTFLAEMVSVRDHDHTVGIPPSHGEMTIDPVVIESNVWIGSKATVIRGAWIREGAVVGAHSVVRGELPPWTVSAGLPARVVRTFAPSKDSSDAESVVSEELHE